MERRSPSAAAGSPLLSRREALAAAFFAASAAGVSARQTVIPPPAWAVLPDTPRLPAGADWQKITIGDVPIFYACFGKGRPVLLLHGGMANSDYWGYQVRHLADRFAVVVIDTRGHGRSAFVGDALGYNRFASDAIAVLDRLDIKKASVIGWSDGAITGLELAMHYPEYVDRLFAFAGNVSRSAMKRCAGACPTFVEYGRRCKAEYAKLSPRSERWPEFRAALGRMWRGQPEYTGAELARIKAPTVVADGYHDEIIKPVHLTQMTRAIRGSRAIVLPNVSHFAMLQDPVGFNAELDRFLTNPV